VGSGECVTYEVHGFVFS